MVRNITAVSMMVAICIRIGYTITGSESKLGLGRIAEGIRFGCMTHLVSSFFICNQQVNVYVRVV